MSDKSKSIDNKNNINQDERLKKVSPLRVLLNRPELGAYSNCCSNANDWG